METDFLKDRGTALAILDRAQEGILIAPVEAGTLRYANPALCALFGYEPAEMLGMEVADLHPAGEAAQLFDRLRRQGEGGEERARALSCRKGSGKTFRADIQAYRLLRDGKECLLVFYTEVPEQGVSHRRSHAELREWQTLFDAIPHPTVILDRDQRITAGNRRLATLLGRPAAEIGPLKCWEIFHGSECGEPPAGCPFRTMRSSGASETKDMEMEAFGGWYLVSCTPIYDGSGRLQKVIHIAIDISDRKEMERRLEQSSNEYRNLSIMLETIFDAIPDIIGVQDLDHGIIRYNKAGYDYLDQTPEGVQGRKCFQLIGRDGPCDPCATSKVYATGKPARIERFFAEISRWIEIRAYPVFDDRGRLARIIEHLRDITDIKQAEQDRVELERQLQQKVRLESLGVLAGGIAHDFNNLLSGIYGYIEMAQLAAGEPKVRDYMAATLKTMDRARSLTQQLLTFSKGGVPDKKVGTLSPFLEETARFAMSGSQASLHLSIAEDLWQCAYDPNQLAQVINNIIINAQQAMPRGGRLEVKARNREIDGDRHASLLAGRYVEVAVGDQGAGIDPAILHRIFDPYFTTKEGGSGLGLATSYSIVKKHGGWIDVESTPGRGSLFRILLPATDAEVTEELPPPTVTTAGSGRILVMDDEEVIRRTLAGFLEHHGYTPVACGDGATTVELFHRSLEEGEPFTAIILDLTIPGDRGGKEIIREIRKGDRDVPVIVTSGYADDPIVQDPGSYGFTASIKKPFSRQELIGVLARHL